MTPPTNKRDPRPALPVIFRMEGKGAQATPVAFFPTVTFEGWDWILVRCPGGLRRMVRIGCYGLTRNARPEDYADLLAELCGIYEEGDDPVRLVPYRRFTARLRDEFRRAARRN